MFQEVHFAIDITRCPVVFGFGRIGFQIDVYHRIVDLCFLKFGQNAVQAIFLIVYRCDRGSTKSAEYLLGVCRKRACSVELEADFQKVRDLVVITCIDGHFAELLMLDVSLFVRVTYAQIETMFRRSSGNTDIIVGDECSLENLILPVGVRVPAAEVERSVLLIGKLFAV